MTKSQSLPGLMKIGTAMPKFDGHSKKTTLGYKIFDKAVDLLKPSPIPAEALTAWTVPAQPEQKEETVGPEDVVPKNMRLPRIAPDWLKYDRKVLRFYGFFQESVEERVDENSRFRHVSFLFYLEDETLQISEPKVENCGLMQGPFLRRHKVPKSDGSGFIGPGDLKCGEEIDIYGIKYHIIGCDKYTRWVYEKNGLDVGEDEPMPVDQWTKAYKFKQLVARGGLPTTKAAAEAKKIQSYMLGAPNVNKGGMIQFLLNDRKVLRFKAYWDDPTPYGARFYFVIHYYLVDNTTEINEAHCRNSGRDAYPMFMKRRKLFKTNILTAVPNMLKAEEELYLPEDFLLGQSINVWGRDVVLYDCDDFTRDFYKGFMGIDQFENKLDVSEKPIVHRKLKPPPHQGVGTEEDSLINCEMIQPKPPKVDLVRMMMLGGEILRFECKMMNGEPEDENRRLVIAYYPGDGHCAVFEVQQRNSGHMGGKFADKRRYRNVDTGKYFELGDFYVGKTVTFAAQPLKIIRADEHCLRFLEARPEQFPYADPRACAERLKPLEKHPEFQSTAGIDPDRLKELADDAGIALIDHEVITLLRNFDCGTEETGPRVCGPWVLKAAR